MDEKENGISLLSDGDEGEEVVEVDVDGIGVSTSLGIKPTAILTFKKLPVSKALQNFAFAGNKIQNGMKIYASQSVDNDTYLSCCVVSTDANGQMIATRESYLKLEGYGHGESLEVDTSVSGKTYLWIGCKGQDGNWSNEIARIQYPSNAANDGTSKPLDVKKLTYLRNATKTGNRLISGCTAKRVSVAIANGDDRICFKISVYDNNNGGKERRFYSIYDLSDINTYLTKNGNTPMEKLKAYCKAVFEYKKLPASSDGGTTSFQSHEIAGVGADSKFLYIAGGHPGKGVPCKIYKVLYTNGDNTKLKKTIKMSKTQEIEGIKVIDQGSNRYIYYTYNVSGDKNNTVLYRFKESNI